jgi:NitT/TauT family transport system permease protein
MGAMNDGISHNMSTRIVRAVAFFVGLVALWEAAVWAFSVPDWLVPPPTQIAGVIIEKNIVILQHAWVTLFETVAGFVLALVGGVIIGVGIVHAPILRDTLYPALIMFNSFPKIALAPLFVIWMGVGLESKIANAFLVAFFPIVINTILGLTAMDPEMLELVRAMTRSRWTLFWKIRLPFSLPYLFAACKIAVSLAVIGAIVGEWISGRSGLGYLVLAANTYFNTSLAFAALIYMVVISLMLYGLVVLAEKLLLPWYRGGT